MLQIRSHLDVADNTGAKLAWAIGVLGKNQRYAHVGDVIKVHIKDATLVELTVLGRDLRQEMFNLRLQQASAQLEKPARLRTIRKDIARVETRISQLRNKAA